VKFISSKNDSGLSEIRVAAVLIFVFLNLAVFLLRAFSVWHCGALFTNGSDASVIYPVWKAVHHLPIYTWPLQFPFNLTLYNYLFYEAYAAFLRLVGASGAEMIPWGNLFTPVFAILGAVAQWKLVQNYLHLRGITSLLSFLFALGLWFCTSIIRSYVLGIRPDIAAVALVMAALWMVVRQPRFGFAYAGVLFYLAWSFKQSAVLSLSGVCLFLLVSKRWRDLSLLVAVFVALTALTLFLGSPEYRYSILVAPRIMSVFSVKWALSIAPKSLVANAYWILAPIALVLAAGVQRLDSSIRMLTTVLAITLLGGLAGMARIGAWDHYLLEAFVSGSTLLQIAVFKTPGRIPNALVLFGCILPALQLATRPSGNETHALGTVGIATATEYDQAAALRDRLALMKKPIFTTNDKYSLPWFSTDNHAPALVVDRIFHNATKAGCSNGCVEGMLQRGEVPTVMLLSSGDIYQSSLNPNYKKISEVRESGRLWSIYVLVNSEPINEALHNRN
jgi:hypothetical protein